MTRWVGYTHGVCGIHCCADGWSFLLLSPAFLFGFVISSGMEVLAYVLFFFIKYLFPCSKLRKQVVSSNVKEGQVGRRAVVCSY